MLVISEPFESILYSDDIWSVLRACDKPCVLYGMGDGADKILDICREKEIPVSGVFASDGFAKGKLFRGFKVITYREMCKIFGDFIVLVAFATSRDEVLQNIYSIAAERELYCPDVPVFGEGLFDKSFVKDNFGFFKKVYGMLADDVSRKTYTDVILAKLTGNPNYLKRCETPVAEAYENIIKPDSSFGYVDIGAYNGDTIREFLHYSGGASSVTAFEPDAKNFKKLCDFAASCGLDTSRFYNIAAWDKCDRLTFYSRSGRNSAGTTSHAGCKSTLVNADTADSRITSRADFINIDAEGADMRVLNGLSDTIDKYKPIISCAVYHRNEDMFALPLRLAELYGGECELYIRHFPYLPAWDTNVYVKSTHKR